MTEKPTEAKIQQMLDMLRKSNKNATREEAIKAVNAMTTMAGTVLNKMDDDLKTGKLKVSKSGKVSRKDLKK